MAVKIADTAKPMADFPVVEAVDVSVTIGGEEKDLQQAIENGDIGGDVQKLTKEEYEALSEEEKAKNTIYSTEENLYYHDEVIAQGFSKVGEMKVLYDTVISASGTYTLADDVNNYDFIVINHTLNGNNTQSITLTKPEIRASSSDRTFLCCHGYKSEVEYSYGYFNGDKVVIFYSGQYINSITGYKFGEVKHEYTIDSADKLPFKLGIDADGNYGYIKAGADTVTPFKRKSSFEYLTAGGTSSYNITIPDGAKYLITTNSQANDNIPSITLASYKILVPQGCVTLTGTQPNSSSTVLRVFKVNSTGLATVSQTGSTQIYYSTDEMITLDFN